jgi:hypothetical protein
MSGCINLVIYTQVNDGLPVPIGINNQTIQNPS